MNAEARAEVLESFTRQVEKLRTSTGWQQWLRVAAKFPTYSLRNQLLIAAQRPDATWVAGYRTWQQLGRQVNRGERGIAIYAPLLRRERSEADEPQIVLAGFRVVRVFDIIRTPRPGTAHPDHAHRHRQAVSGGRRRHRAPRTVDRGRRNRGPLGRDDTR